MSLPKIKYPISEIELKSLNRKVKYRPMITADERILLIAKQSETDNDVFTAVKQVVNNCVLDKNFDVDDLPLYELEEFFIKLRIESIGGELNLTFKDSEDGKDYIFPIKLSDIKVRYPDDPVDPKVHVNETVGVLMRHPPASLYDNQRFLTSKDVNEISEELMLSSIREVWDDDDSYLWKDQPKEDQQEFLGNIPSTVYRTMQRFIATTPHVEHVIRYVNKAGTERTITLRTLSDFFTL